MKTLSISYLNLFRLFITFTLAILILLPTVYEWHSTPTTFFSILAVGTFILLAINSNAKVRYISLMVFYLKSFLLLFLYNNGDYHIFPDSYGYVKILDDIVMMGTYDFNSVVLAADTLHVGFYYFYLFIYQFFNSNDLSILLVNTLMISISAILFYEVIKVRFAHRIAFVTFVLFSLSSNVFMFGSLILKDPIVIFLTALSLYLYLVKKRIFIPILLAMFLVTVRIYSGFSVIVAIVIDYLLFSQLSRKRKFWSFIGLTLLSLVMLSSPTVQSYLDLGTRFVFGASIVNVIISVPLALIKFFFAPLPWNLLSGTEVYRFLIFDSALAVLFSLSLLKFVLSWFKFKELRYKFYVFLIPILIHAFALGVEYGGDSTRQRSGIIVFLILTFVIGMFYKNKKEEKQVGD